MRIPQTKSSVWGFTHIWFHYANEMHKRGGGGNTQGKDQGGEQGVEEWCKGKGEKGEYREKRGEGGEEGEEECRGKEEGMDRRS
ncbi:hypothetical protein SNE40_012368 [Patella caerulea]|uniref:Uncharacterized protein n=1 Tax=Patella caerulea TaxID=87958 RepID=A0AAN8JUD0_PATCE